MDILSSLDLSRLVPELLLVLIFIVFVLEMMKRFDAKESARDTLFINFMREERESRLSSMREERDNRREGMARLADEMKQTNILIAANNAVLNAHDARMTSASERLLLATETKTKSNR